MNVKGSVGLTPNNRFYINLVSANEASQADHYAYERERHSLPEHEFHHVAAPARPAPDGGRSPVCAVLPRRRSRRESLPHASAKAIAAKTPSNAVGSTDCATDRDRTCAIVRDFGDRLVPVYLPHFVADRRRPTGSVFVGRAPHTAKSDVGILI